MLRVRLVSLITLILAATGSVHGDETSTDFAIVGINVIPMDEERVLQGQTVVVMDGTIQSISDAASTTLPADLRQIDGNDRYLMPGLVDLHIHLAGQDELINYLAWGVTTVMHLGASESIGRNMLDYRERVRDGSLLGPNIYTTNRILDGDPPIASGAVSLDSAEAARKAVRDLKENGYDFVKIYNNVSLPVFEAIVDEAQRQALAVIGHIPRGFDTLAAMRGGQNAVVHTEEFFFAYFDGPRSTVNMVQQYEPDLSKLPELIDALVEHKVAVMPDLSFTFTNLLMWDDLELVWNDPEFPYLHPDIASMWEVSNINRRAEIENHVRRDQWKYNLMQKLTRDFQAAGILQVVGTDASLPGLFPGGAVHRELTELVKAGISNFETLAIGSRNAGEFIRRYIDKDVRLGLIAPGYRADFILLDSNPLEDVRNARRLSAVVVNGRFTDKSELDGRRATLRTRFDSLHSVNDAVDSALASDNAKSSIKALARANSDNAEALETIESRINAAGYAAAYADDLDRSELLLELNTQLFGASANTWDSLAEIVLYRGDSDRALQLYRKALAIDPTLSSARESIENILGSETE